MRFQPKSEESIQEERLMAAGEYDFEVNSAEDTTSKNGNEMIKLELRIWDDQGRERILTDFLLEKMAAKLRHFSDSAGILNQYEQGAMSASACERKQGRVKIAIEEDKTGQYPPKNVVKDYITRKAKPLVASKPRPTVATVPDEAPIENDDVPF